MTQEPISHPLSKQPIKKAPAAAFGNIGIVFSRKLLGATDHPCY